MGWASLPSGGKGIAIEGATVILLRGKASVTIGGSMAVLNQPGEWVAGTGDISFSALEPDTEIASVGGKY